MSFFNRIRALTEKADTTLKIEIHKGMGATLSNQPNDKNKLAFTEEELRLFTDKITSGYYKRDSTKGIKLSEGKYLFVSVRSKEVELFFMGSEGSTVTTSLVSWDNFTDIVSKINPGKKK